MSEILSAPRSRVVDQVLGTVLCIAALAMLLSLVALSWAGLHSQAGPEWVTVVVADGAVGLGLIYAGTYLLRRGLKP